MKARVYGSCVFGHTLILLAGGCVPATGQDCGAPSPAPAAPSASPIARALAYLEATQLAADLEAPLGRDYAGDWPQCFAFDESGPYIRDPSPFNATFIHHALALIVEQNREALGLSAADLATARRMRQAAVDFMLRFRAGPECPDAGTFGFWPHLPQQRSPIDALLSILADAALGGPELMGVRAPINVSFYPPDLAIPTDADDTACVYAALIDNSGLDGGAPVEEPLERFLADWRDLGQVPRRNNPSWMPPASGAFLTWLAYHDDPSRPNPNEVDLVVNANVLYALGRSGRLDTPGVEDAIRLIHEATRAGVHRAAPQEASLYYPDNNALHYCVARAYSLGGVGGLWPAVQELADDLLDSAYADQDERWWWDKGAPHLNTALAAVALLYAGYDGPQVTGAVDYLVREQDPLTGAWQPGAFFQARFDDGRMATWVSPPLTTAFALEALARYELSRTVP